MSRFLFAVLASLTLFQFSIPAQADDAAITKAHPEREAFAKDFAQTVITILHDHKKSYADRKDVLRRAFSNSVDIDWIAKFALGRYWRDATDEQKARYTSLYRHYLTESYITNFAENPGKGIYDIKIAGVADDVQDSNFLVHTQMRLMNQVNLRVDYLVSDNQGCYKVLDIVIENVSLINTHRAEFSALASANGVDGVIKKLEQLAAETKPEITLSMK